jgi:HEAT repeat protein
VSAPWTERFESPRAEERAAACRDAARDPAGPLLVEPLVARLGDPVTAVANAAAEALVVLARGSDGVVPLVRGAVRRGSSPGRIFATLALARLEPAEPGWLPALVDGLAAAEGDVRWRAARVLVDLGRLHPETVGVLLGLLRGGDPPAVRRMAGFALRELAPDLPEAAAGLLEATHDPEPTVRRAAVTALAGLAAPPESVLARLLELLEDRDPTLAGLAALALAGLGDLGARRTEAVSRLRAVAAGNASESRRRAAARAVERLEGPVDPAREAGR